MPSNNTPSPYAASFKSAIKRGTPCSTAVQNIAKRTNKPTTSIYNSLFKAGWVQRQKFNGQWIYWPTNCKKSNATHAKHAQWTCWQSFVDWCIAAGWCTPEQLHKHCGSQKAFMTFCRKFFAAQFPKATPKKSSKRSTPKRSGRKSAPKRPSKKSTPRTTSKSRKPRPTAKSRRSGRSSKPASYKFPTARTRKAA